MARVKLIFADGDTSTIEARLDEAVLAAARRHGLRLASDCEVGDCQTCRAMLRSGRVTYDESASLSLDAAEIDGGAVLCCVARPEEDVVIDLPYLRAHLLPERPAIMKVTALARLSKTTMAVQGRLDGAPPLAFHPGQYVNVTVPHCGAVRSYSMVTAPEDGGRFEFLVRLLEGGAMSVYLTERARPGDAIELRGPRGVFYLRDNDRPLVMIAGGTGIAPIVSMLRSMVRRRRTERPVTLCFGVTEGDDAFYGSELAALGTQFPDFELRRIAVRGGGAWNGRTGLVTELLERRDVREGNIEAYLCGPPAMIGAARDWLSAAGVANGSIYAEEFSPSGTA